MPFSFGERFTREMGCTPREWLAWLPAAVGEHAWTLEEDQARVDFAGGGNLTMRWQVLPPRVIALLRQPRMQVDFAFSEMNETLRYRFMKRFDLYMQRGGG